MGTRSPDEPDPSDNWFGESGWPLDDDARVAPRDEIDVEDWLTAPPQPPPSASPSERALIWIALGLALVGLFVGLKIGGVLGGHTNKPHAPAVAPQPTVAQTSRPATTATPNTPLTVPTKTLKPGDTGAQVVALQHALASLGFSPGSTDGSYGPATTSAVTRFQQAVGLTADGVVGPNTLAALLRRAGP